MRSCAEERSSDLLNPLNSLYLEAFIDFLLGLPHLSYGLRTIKDLNNLLERESFGLRETAESDCKNDDKETTEDYIILPSKVLQSYWVSESGDNKGYIDRQEFAGQSLATQAVWKNLGLAGLVSFFFAEKGEVSTYWI